MLKIIPSGTTHRTFWRRRTTFYSGEPTQEGEVLWRGIVGAVVVEGDVGHLPRSRGDAPLPFWRVSRAVTLSPKEGYVIKSQNYAVIWSQNFTLSQSILGI